MRSLGPLGPLRMERKLSPRARKCEPSLLLAAQSSEQTSANGGWKDLRKMTRTGRAARFECTDAAVLLARVRVQQAASKRSLNKIRSYLLFKS